MLWWCSSWQEEKDKAVQITFRLTWIQDVWWWMQWGKKRRWPVQHKRNLAGLQHMQEGGGYLWDPVYVCRKTCSCMYYTCIICVRTLSWLTSNRPKCPGCEYWAVKVCTVAGTSAPIVFSGGWGVGVDPDDVWFCSHESVIHTPRAPVMEIPSMSCFSLTNVYTHLLRASNNQSG